MADVNIQQTPGGGSSSGSGSGFAWAIVVIVLLGVIAWFIFGGGIKRESTTKVDINVPGEVVPNAPAPNAPSTPSPTPPGGAKKP